jgi:hypothetical protein
MTLDVISMRDTKFWPHVCFEKFTGHRVRLRARTGFSLLQLLVGPK